MGDISSEHHLDTLLPQFSEYARFDPCPERHHAVRLLLVQNLGVAV